jgi:hypothetical protein
MNYRAAGSGQKSNDFRAGKTLAMKVATKKIKHNAASMQSSIENVFTSQTKAFLPRKAGTRFMGTPFMNKTIPGTHLRQTKQCLTYAL